MTSDNVPHSIRLRGPWEYELRNPDGWTRSGQVSMPAVYGDLAVEPCQGQSIRLSRRFNRPTGLGPTSRIELVIKNPVAAGVVYINDLMVCESLKIDATTRVDVSRELLARNTLVIVLETPSVSNSDSWNDLSASNFKQIIEDVRLEIDDGPSLQK